MEVPFTARLKHGFGAGHSLIIRGKPHHANSLFAITFLDGMDMLETQHDFPKATAIFHVSCRFVNRTVVMNTCTGKGWGPEEVKPGFPLQADTNNEIKIVCTDYCYEVFFNGKLFGTFMHRYHQESVTHFNFYGDFKIQEVIYN